MIQGTPDGTPRFAPPSQLDLFFASEGSLTTDLLNGHLIARPAPLTTRGTFRRLFSTRPRRRVLTSGSGRFESLEPRVVLAAPTAAQAQAEWEAALAAFLSRADLVDPLVALETNHTGADLVTQINATSQKLFQVELDQNSPFYAGSPLGTALDDPGLVFSSGPPPFNTTDVMTPLGNVNGFASGFGTSTAAQLGSASFIPWNSTITSSEVYGENRVVTASDSSGGNGVYTLDSNGNASAQLSYITSRVTTNSNGDSFAEMLNVGFLWNRTGGQSNVDSANITWTRTPQAGGATQRVGLTTSNGSLGVEIQKYVEGPNSWNITVGGQANETGVRDLNVSSRYSTPIMNMMAQINWHNDDDPATDDRIDVTGELDYKKNLGGDKELRVGALVRRDYMTTQAAARMLYFSDAINYVGAMTGFVQQNDSQDREFYGSLLAQTQVVSPLGPAALKLNATLFQNGDPDSLPIFTFASPVAAESPVALWLTLHNGDLGGFITVTPPPFGQFLQSLFP